jgi:outer membrane protein assembly factor BamB
MRKWKLVTVAALLGALGTASWMRTRGRGEQLVALAPRVGVVGVPLAPSAEHRPAPPLGTGPVRPGPASMLHLDAHHTNRSPFDGPTSPHIAWTFATGGPVQSAVVELDDGSIWATSLGGKLFALSAAGALQFTVDLGERGYATPLVLRDRVYVGSDAHRFLAIDRQGSVRLQLQTDGDVDTGAVASPWGGLLFASGRVVYATKPDGTVIWRVQAKRKCYSSPAVGDDGTTYVGSQDDHVYAIDREGAVRWRVDLGGDVDSAPVLLDDGTVVVGTDRGQVVALEPLRGDIRWTVDVGGYVRGALSVTRDGNVLVGTYGPKPRVVALAGAHGEARTVFAMQGAAGTEVGIHGAPVEDASGRLFFGAEDDTVYALGADGSLLWKLRTQGDVDAPAVITSHGLLVVGSDDGTIYAIGPP